MECIVCQKKAFGFIKWVYGDMYKNNDLYLPLCKSHALQHGIEDEQQEKLIDKIMEILEEEK